MQKLMREPLLHFFLLGAGIFATYHFFAGGNAEKPTEIIVSQGRIESLADAFRLKWQRPPNAVELDGLIRDYVREEVYAREATALGLDRDDEVIRQRLMQKLEFVSQDLTAPPEPSDQELKEWLSAHPEKFRVEDQFTFRQVYLNPQRHGIHLDRDAAQLLQQLRETGPAANLTNLGDSLMLEQRFEATATGSNSRQFGETFAAELAKLEPGTWQGPIRSGYGMHLVLVEKRIQGGIPPLEEIRNAVRRDWINARRHDANEKFYDALLQRYAVTIEKPPVPLTTHTLAEAGR